MNTKIFEESANKRYSINDMERNELVLIPKPKKRSFNQLPDRIEVKNVTEKYHRKNVHEKQGLKQKTAVYFLNK